jgi:hypothetical protein
VRGGEAGANGLSLIGGGKVGVVPETGSVARPAPELVPCTETAHGRCPRRPGTDARCSMRPCHPGPFPLDRNQLGCSAKRRYRQAYYNLSVMFRIQQIWRISGKTTSMAARRSEFGLERLAMRKFLLGPFSCSVWKPRATGPACAAAIPWIRSAPTSRRRPAPHSRPTGSAAIPTSSPFA